MILEFTGGTSSGKTSLIKTQIFDHKSSVKGAITAQDYFLKFFFIKLNSGLIKTLLLDILLLPWILRTLITHPKYFSQVVSKVRKSPCAFWMKLNIIRNFLKNLTLFYFCRSNPSRSWIVFDEGPLQILFSLFAHFKSHPNEVEIAHFLQSIPLAEQIVIVHAKPEQVIQRSIGRQDPAWGTLTHEQWKVVAESSETIFQVLSNTPSIMERAIIVRDEKLPSTFMSRL